MIFQTIITASALAENLDTPNWLILDCRGGALNDKYNYKKYIESHIPNAFYCVFAENYTSIFDRDSSCSSFSAAEPDNILQSLNENGFDETSQIVIYDDNTSPLTDTMWLILRSIGCQSVAVLQGGFTSWLANEMPLTHCKNLINKELTA